MMAAPPQWARWLLSVRLPASDRDEVIGDLNEEFAEVAAARGRMRARIWYGRHALRLAWTLGGQPPCVDSSSTSGRSRVTFDELRYAMRRLKKKPAATIASIATLSAAIGAAVATWSLLSAVLIRPLPLVKTDGLVFIGERSAEAPDTVPFTYARHTYQTFRTVRESGTFERVSAIGVWFAYVTIDGAATSRQVGFVTDDFFETLGVHPRAGRGFLPGDDRPGASPVAVLSDRFWRRSLRADEGVIGREIVIGGQPVPIVGIMPAGFNGLAVGGGPDVYAPVRAIADLSGNRSDWLAEKSRSSLPTWLTVVARLRAGTDATQAAARLAAQERPIDMKNARYAAIDLASAALGDGRRLAVSAFARLLGTTVGLLLLIGCLTVGMLVLLRTEARRDEFALCLAMGATRARLAGGVVLEATLLSIAGAALAVPLSWWCIAGVRAFVLPGNINIDQLDLPVDWRTMAAATAAAATATLVIALVAGVFGVSANVADALRARAAVTPRIGRRRTRAALVIAQMAIALVLLAGAGLFARSLVAALSLNPDYDTSRIAKGTVSLPALTYTPDRARTFVADLQARLAQDAAIRSVSLSGHYGGWSTNFTFLIDGEPRKPPALVNAYVIDDRYFSTLGLPMLKGRDFSVNDRNASPLVAIVNAPFGRFVGKGGDAVGRYIEVGLGPGEPPRRYEVVGVVPDIVGIQSAEPLLMYWPIAQVKDASPRTITLRAAGDPALAIREAVATVRAMDPAIETPDFMTIDDGLMRQMGAQRFGATVLGALGTIAAVLTLFGMYVLAESMAAARRREMGVRAALGATRSHLSALVLSQTTRLVGLGIGAGLLLIRLGAGLIRAFLYRVEPFDVPTMGTVIVLMFGLAIAVTLRPALRAARVDLASVLREE